MSSGAATLLTTATAATLSTVTRRRRQAPSPTTPSCSPPRSYSPALPPQALSTRRPPHHSGIPPAPHQHGLRRRVGAVQSHSRRHPPLGLQTGRAVVGAGSSSWRQKPWWTWQGRAAQRQHSDAWCNDSRAGGAHHLDRLEMAQRRTLLSPRPWIAQPHLTIPACPCPSHVPCRWRSTSGSCPPTHSFSRWELRWHAQLRSSSSTPPPCSTEYLSSMISSMISSLEHLITLQHFSSGASPRSLLLPRRLSTA